jgi:hypothetical protein
MGVTMDVIPDFLTPAADPLLAQLGIPPHAPRWELRTVEPIVAGSTTALVEIRSTHVPSARQPFPLPYAERPDDWGGLHFTISGSSVDLTAPRPDWRTLGLRDADGRVHAVRIWHERVWRDGSPLYAEWSHLPSGSQDAIVGGWQHGYQAQDRKDAERAVRLLLSLPHEPRGRRAEAQDRARQRLLEAGRRACKRLAIYPEEVTHALLAHELGRKARPGQGGRVSDLLTRAGWELTDVKDALEPAE